MKNMFVDVFLDVKVAGKLMVANLVFSNNTSGEVYLDKKTICTNGKTRRNLFIITDENNQPVKYVGEMEKRIVVPEDFIPIQSGDTISTCIELNEVYQIIQGKKYTVQLSVYHPNYKDEGPLNKLESNKVEISY
ncbi:hypothetical protein [Niastella populi]|uniref:Uncharacterized protein n=1 Tax=Niastella populi TaxID=550983 RepID=A0A1V9F578_9BACT|nr:hypothetical protein [Niastella populi]OQP53559.1 hypothetical protein A4R26_06165 [Niastella populi]